ncbi:MAG: NAD(P)/FAD-dependent oxidoreductase [Gracilibacteraceae bacterium]|jgi:glycerol-3-phosphate dehydrogenase|nr:NAD(P)/FAD-dependent oxidoreductase [Gracilibacteraceae bacterium]
MDADVDVAVIGGGVLGCFAARNLRRFNLRVQVVEREFELCGGITKANTGIVYSGYDTKPGSLKARLTLRASRAFPQLCRELSVPFRPTGSLMTAAGPRATGVLQKKYATGLALGVPGLVLLAPPQIAALAPGLAPGVSAALYSPGMGAVNPWELGLAAADNAQANGAVFRTATAVSAMERRPEGYRLALSDNTILRARAVVNAAGLSAGQVSELLMPPYFQIRPTRGDYIILDPRAQAPGCIIQQEPEQKGKGATIVPTVDGNLLLGTSDEAVTRPGWTTTEASGLDFVARSALAILPGLDLSLTIRTFAALRPNPYWVKTVDGAVKLSTRSIEDFLIDEPEDYPGFVNLAGIKTPGLTCADEIGLYVAERLAERLGAVPNRKFDPSREAGPRFGRLRPEEQMTSPPATIVCRCQKVTEDEVRQAIRAPLPATTIDGVKRRAGCGMGRCQGGYCTEHVLRLLAEEQGLPVGALCKEQEGSWVVCAKP